LRFTVFLLSFIVGIIAATALVRSEPVGRTAEQYQIMSVADMLHPENGWLQVRVQQRVIIRIPNVQRPSRQALDMAAAVPALKKQPQKMKEKKIGKCLWVNKLSAARPGTGKKQNLELMTKSGGVIRAYLSGGCLAREFYAGAYMEKAKDGKLCADRDVVHARSGAKCEIDKFRLLVAAK